MKALEMADPRAPGRWGMGSEASSVEGSAPALREVVFREPLNRRNLRESGGDSVQGNDQ